jgi:hypothetical protein
MAHWAEIDKNGIVLRVLYHESKTIDEQQKKIAEEFGYEYNPPEDDGGYQWLIDNLGGTWIQTSYNESIRKNFASVGFKYDKKRDAFIPPQLYDSWKLNEDTCLWEAPKTKPEGEAIWDEENLSWIEIKTDGETLTEPQV